MPEFTYIGDAGRSYPSLPVPANAPEPGTSYTLKANPGDGRWLTAGEKPPTVAELRNQLKALGGNPKGLKKAELEAAIAAAGAAPPVEETDDTDGESSPDPDPANDPAIAPTEN